MRSLVFELGQISRSADYSTKDGKIVTFRRTEFTPMTQHLVALLWFFLLSSIARAQGPYHGPAEKETKRYFSPSIALTHRMFRDEASSPLFYRGPGLSIGLGDQLEHLNHWSEFRTSFYFNLSSAAAPTSSYMPANTGAFYMTGRIHGIHLRHLHGLSNGANQFSVGAKLVSDFNIRVNNSLGNATAGLEALANLMVSGKYTRNLNRQRERILRLGIANLRLPAVERHIDFRLDVGALNLNYRPGYAYLNDAELDGESQPGLGYVLSGHAWKLNGWRLGSELGFTRMKTNTYGTRFAYVWEMLYAPGRYEAFASAGHHLRFTFLFNTTKRKK